MMQRDVRHLFATIPQEESARLHQIVKGLNTEAEVLATLGKPSQVYDPGAMVPIDPEKGGDSDEHQEAKILVFSNHSETANIIVYVARDGQVWHSINPKKSRKPEANS
jgi:hypothetical protein